MELNILKNKGKILKAVLAVVCSLNFLYYNVAFAFNNDIKTSMLRTNSIVDRKDGGQIEKDLSALSGVFNSAIASKIRTKFESPQGQPAGQYTDTYHGYNLTNMLASPVDQIPDEVIEAIKASLDHDTSVGRILSSVVLDFGGTDVDIHVTHRYGEFNAAVQRVVLEAVKAGAAKAQEVGLLKPGIDIASMSLEEMAKQLQVKVNERSIVERGSEPVLIGKVVGGGIGAANIILYTFAVPGYTPLQKLGLAAAPGFRFIVRRTDDVLKGNFNGPVWQFEVSEERKDKEGKVIPSKSDAIRLLTLASLPNDYQITAVYPIEGGKISAKEPLASVVYQPVYAEDGTVRALNPSIIFRSQSAADAVAGVAKRMIAPHFVPGGTNGQYYVATRATSLAEARKAPSEGLAHVVFYGWQSEDNGKIPPEGIIDHLGLNPPAIGPERNLATKLAEVMTTHPFDQPYLTSFAAQAWAEEFRRTQRHLFKRAPKEADIDPIMDEVEKKVSEGEYLSITIDKADMGGRLGHNIPEVYMQAVNLATMLEAKENGALAEGNIIGYTGGNRLLMDTKGIGDDEELIMIGDRTHNSANSHQVAFLGFTRGYLLATVNKRKPYGLAQDYQGKEAKAAKEDPFGYSKLNPRFLEILREVMPTEELWMIDNLEKAWEEWKAKGSDIKLPPPFSGNVSQQGIGSARIPLDIANGERGFDIIAGDKMGPAALNRPIREGVYAALNAGEFQNGLVFEIWDAKSFDEHGNIPLEELPENYADIADPVASLEDINDQNFVKNAYDASGKLKKLSLEDRKELAGLLKQAGFVPTQRIFLDAKADKDAVFAYLADSDRFNIKHVWSKKRSGWDIKKPGAFLLKPVLGSSVTKLGILAGGEYIGKDDPVMLGDTKLMRYLHEFLRTSPIIIQGDMNGSHWLASVPTEFKHAVATKESHAIMVGFHYELNDDGTIKSVQDLYGDAYAEQRDRIFQFNLDFNLAQLGGQFEPYGTNWRTVEASYPLAKQIRDLNKPDSPFLMSNMTETEKENKPVGLLTEIPMLFAVATAPDMAAAAEELGIKDGGTRLVDETKAGIIAGTLGASSRDVIAFLQASAGVYKRYSGDRFDKFLEALNNTQKTAGKAGYRTVVLSADVISRSTVSMLAYTEIIGALAKVENLKVYIYGKDQRALNKLKVLAGNNNVVLVSSLSDVLKDNKKEDTLLLVNSVDDVILKDSQAKQVRQLQAVNPVLTMAAALNALYGQAVHDIFRQMFKQVAIDDNGVINGAQVYKEKQDELVKGELEAGELSKLLVGIKTDISVTDDTAQVAAQIQETANRVGV